MATCSGCGNETNSGIFQRGKGHLCMRCSVREDPPPAKPLRVAPITLGDLMVDLLRQNG